MTHGSLKNTILISPTYPAKNTYFSTSGFFWKKTGLILLIVLNLALASALLIFIFTYGDQLEDTPPLEIPEIIPSSDGKSYYFYMFKSFSIPYPTMENQLSMLSFDIGIMCHDKNSHAILSRWEAHLRSEIYHYLLASDGAFLEDFQNRDQIKQELEHIFDRSLPEGYVHDILYECILNK